MVWNPEWGVPTQEWIDEYNRKSKRYHRIRTLIKQYHEAERTEERTDIIDALCKNPSLIEDLLNLTKQHDETSNRKDLEG